MRNKDKLPPKLRDKLWNTYSKIRQQVRLCQLQGAVYVDIVRLGWSN